MSTSCSSVVPHITADRAAAATVTAAALRVAELSCHAATMPCVPGRLEAVFNVWSCLYVVWRVPMAQSGCGSSVLTAWATPVPKIRPQKHLKAPT